MVSGDRVEFSQLGKFYGGKTLPLFSSQIAASGRQKGL